MEKQKKAPKMSKSTLMKNKKRRMKKEKFYTE